jgi:MFS family permease
LPSLAVSWGIVTLGVGFTTKWTQLIACRILLGVLESGFYPGCIFLLSCWYCRFQVQKRFSGFYLLALLAPGFSNILAWALSLMNGVGGLAGWRWIFIMQGIITICLGLMGYIFIVDFPDRSTQPQLITRRPFLTVEEAEIIKARIDRDRGDAVVDSLNPSKVLHHLHDWKLWEWAWLYLLNNVVTYSFGFFLPIILSGDVGYSTTMAQILSFPPYVAAAPWMLSTAWFADRYRKRGIILILNASAAIVGIAMTGFIRSNPAARYAGVFLGGGAVGGIIASNISRQADAPEYAPAMIAAILTQAVTVLHVGKNFWVYGRANRRADKGVTVVEGQRGFRYTL